MDINPFDFNHIRDQARTIIDILYQSCIAEGGDGDALWYSPNYSVEDILPLIKEYNDKLKYPWSIDFQKEEETILWGEQQEWVIITNDKKYYDTTGWATLEIKW
jgi:hypothetical protein